ncbi:MAG TPA: HD-GYP domain-containing protein [Longimicrobium sp.]|jgi:HD-GYP domain-containing protein (c-di-GMP phosphodiesterase class II)|uniref:HD-GYP domain-containing protein n=1 Tax=Longimicrobium sp. TaxID=2029185 RepID=UPI002EDB7A50
MPNSEAGQGTRTAAVAMVSAGLVGLAWMVEASARQNRTRMMHRRMVELALNALSAGDPVTARHSRRVADLCYALGQACRMPRRELPTLRVAALLHDMGKIDDRFFHIVHSRKRLSKKERSEIKSHPHESAHILAPLEPEHPGIRAIVSSHHECWNGSGYPCGLKGDDIPLGARIIALADAFDAMTQPRKYRDAMPLEDALEELRKGAGSQFDPALVELAHTPAVRERWNDVAERDLFAERNAASGVTE